VASMGDGMLNRNLQVEKAYATAKEKAKVMMENEPGLLDRLGNARHVFKAILGFGSAVAEVGSK
jgi:hypothetical protein